MAQRAVQDARGETVASWCKGSMIAPEAHVCQHRCTRAYGSVPAGQCPLVSACWSVTAGQCLLHACLRVSAGAKQGSHKKSSQRDYTAPSLIVATAGMRLPAAC